MANDIFICGDCQTIFDDLSQFVTHKKDGCPGVSTQGQEVTEGQEGEVEMPNQIYIIQTPSMEEDGSSTADQEVTVSEQQMTSEYVIKELLEGEQREEGEVDLMDVQMKDDNEDLPTPHVELVPIDGGNSSGLQIILKQHKRDTPVKTSKKRGRPRKVTKENEEEIEPKVQEKPLPPEKGSDGLYHCVKCKKTYSKERHLLTHKCMGSGDYLDIMNKEAVAEHSDIEEEDEEEEEYVQEKEFRVQPRGRGRGRGRGRPRGRPRNYTPRGVVYMRAKKPEAVPDVPDATEELPPDVEPQLGIEQSVPTPENSDPNDPGLPKRPRIRHELPIFLSEDEKVAFEESLSVDFESDVAHLYSVHVIEQNINENAPPAASRSSNFLNVFSCNVCSKVFMALSQVKTHCLSHTELRPYRCIKCDYATNCKGNLYTHMRKHTGQLYKCDLCEFRSANRTHLVEHEATHRPEKHQCFICKKRYNTYKSMLNHVRKYHDNTKEGRTLLDSLQGKQKKGPAMLHQCHVCNRKFKKKIDRDRHLFVHNIRDSDGGVYVCKLCGHASVRREYFLKHVARHRIIYRCSLCVLEFASCQKMNQHLLEAHEECNNNQSTLQSVFEESIKSSLFLPEPDGSLDAWLEGATKPEPDSQDEEAPEIADSLILKHQGNLPLLSDESTVPTESSLAFEAFTELGYKEMTLEIFSKLRETFGQEECEFCGRLFFYKNDYLTHVRTHTGEKPFKCNECEFRTITKETLRQHIEKVHRSVCYMCEECALPFRSMKSLLTHQQHKHSLTGETADAVEGTSSTGDHVQQMTCTMCDLTFDTIKRMKIHLQMKHENISPEEIRQLLAPFTRQQGRIGRKTYKCPYCDKMFCRGSADLQKHLWVHEGVKPYKCPVCPHACRSKSNLSAHMIKHSAEKPFLCTHCGKEYKSRTALRWHVRSHKTGKLFKCHKCPYEATQSSHLKRHMETHDVVKRYSCSLCDYSSNTIGYMKIHYTRHHKGQQFDATESVPKPMASETKVYRCLSCDYMFGNLSDMKRHLRVRHHLASEDMRSLEGLDEGVTVLQAEVDAPATQILQLSEGGEHSVTTALDHLQYPSELQGENEIASLQVVDVNSDQHQQHTEEVIDEVMVPSSSLDVVSTSEVTTPDGYMAVNPEAIIIQHEQEVVLTQDGVDNQYVIQYVLQEGDEGADTLSMVTEEAPPTHSVLAVASSNYVPTVQEVKEILAAEDIVEAGDGAILKIDESFEVVKTEEEGKDVIAF